MEKQMPVFKPKGFSDSIYFQLVEDAIPLIVLVQPVKKIVDIANSLIAYTNMQFFKNRDMTREQILKMTFHQLLSDIIADERDVVQYLLTLMSKGEVTQLRLPVKGKDGASQYVMIRSRIRQNDEGYFYAQGIFTDVTEFALLSNSLQSAEEEVSILHRALRNYGGFGDILGGSEKMEKIYSLLHHLAFVDTNVLIQGETGTGKELVARELHRRYCPDSPFVPVNCGAMPDGTLESELFGHVRGAFTGASRDYNGLFRSASGGILFLDEIGELSLSFQVKLLRVLQESEVRPVGSDRTIKVDVRVIAATHRDLKDMVRKGTFREDLYYRLNVVPIQLPALRDRHEDISHLIEHFLKSHSMRLQKSVKGVSKEAMMYLMNYAWPGNVRELENLMERLVVLADKEILDTSDLPFDIFLKSRKTRLPSLTDTSILLKDARDQFEREYIKAVLERSGWNQTETARILGIHRNTLTLKREQLGIEKHEEVQ